MRLLIQQVPVDERIASLLESNGLPTEDLAASQDVLLFACTADNSLYGTVGLELYGSIGLVRSLAVAPARRSEGTGATLLSYAERFAAGRGVSDLFLLTTTAEQYFASRGYTLADRASAPAAIKNTKQFSGLCSATAVFMVKHHVGSTPHAAQRVG